MAYTYDPIFAADPNNPAVVASNAAILIYDPADTGKSPIAITDSSGSPLPNPVTVNKNGFGPAFQHPTIDRVAWSGGGFEGFFTSYEGMKNAALDAATAANASAGEAATAAANASAAATASLASAVADAEAAQAAATAAANLVGAPADSAIATAINATGSATKTALNATYAQKWKPNTAYTQGQPVINPSGDTVTAKVAFTSGATYNDANWNIAPAIAAINNAAATAAPVRPTQPKMNITAGTQPGHTVTVIGTAKSSNLNDTTDFILGRQAINFVTTNATGLAGPNVSGLSLDMTDKGFVLWCKVDDFSKVSATVDFQAINGANSLTNSRILNGQGFGEDVRQFKSGEWFKLFLPYSTLSVASGTLLRNAVAQLRARFYPQGASDMKIHFNGFGTYDEPKNTYPNGVVSMTYDDTWLTQYTDARADLDKYGWRGTMYPIVDQVGVAGHLTLAQIKSLHDDSGWEIGAHADNLTNHANGYVALTTEARQAALAISRKWQLDNGFGDSGSFAYPLGRFDAATIKDVSKYWVSGRTVYSEGGPEVVGSPYPFRLRAVSCGPLTLAQMKAYVDQAKASRAHVIFIFHNLVTTKGADTNDVLLSDHLALVDYIAAQGVDVKPVSEVVRGAAN